MPRAGRVDIALEFEFVVTWKNASALNNGSAAVLVRGLWLEHAASDASVTLRMAGGATFQRYLPLSPFTGEGWATMS